MELALDILKYTAITFVAGALGWLFSKIKTPREKKATDLDLINKAIAPLLKSITDLSHHNTETIDKLVKEQAKNRSLWLENSRLADKVENLQKQIDQLTTEIKKISK
ncbi:MAG: hypothetical protein LBH22_09175 [Bacteroidales bacterium]|jgi:septal ring factor EnvC (AmiA/AmiB activator)|nr:hypothetical protein [Bacteroidales bacterium]